MGVGVFKIMDFIGMILFSSNSKRCIKNGEYYKWNSSNNQYNFFIFELSTNSSTIYYEVPTGVNMYVNTKNSNLFRLTSFEFPYLTDDNYTFSLTARNAYFVPSISVIGIPAAGAKYLFLSVKAPIGSSYIYLDTTNDWVNINPISMYNPYEYAFAILSTSIIVCDNDIRILFILVAFF